jgi:hypothetical protein
MLGVVPILVQALGILPGAIRAGLEVKSLIDEITAAASSSSDPTDAQWQAVNAKLDELTARLNQDPV